MKTVKIVAIVMVALVLIRFVRGDRYWELSDILPFWDSHPFGFYDLVALAMIALTIHAICQLLRRRASHDEDE